MNAIIAAVFMILVIAFLFLILAFCLKLTDTLNAFMRKLNIVQRQNEIIYEILLKIAP